MGEAVESESGGFEMLPKAEIERRVAERVDAIKVGWPVAYSLSEDRAKVLVVLPIEGKPRGARHVTIEADGSAASLLALKVASCAAQTMASTALGERLWGMVNKMIGAGEAVASSEGTAGPIVTPGEVALRGAVRALACAIGMTALERWVQLHPARQDDRAPLAHVLAEALRDDGKASMLAAHSRAADAMLVEMQAGHWRNVGAFSKAWMRAQALGTEFNPEITPYRETEPAPPRPAEVMADELVERWWKRRPVVSPEPSATAEANIPPSGPAASDSPDLLHMMQTGGSKPGMVQVSRADLLAVSAALGAIFASSESEPNPRVVAALERIRDLLIHGAGAAAGGGS